MYSNRTYWPNYYRKYDLTVDWEPEIRRLHAAGWSDREMAVGRCNWKTGDPRPGLKGNWTRRSVQYWRNKLGLPPNRERTEKHLRTLAERKATAWRQKVGKWARYVPAGQTIRPQELAILNILDMDRKSMTRKELARAAKIHYETWVFREPLRRLKDWGLVFVTGKRPKAHDGDPGKLENEWGLRSHVHRLEHEAGRRPTSVEQEQTRLGLR